MTSSNYILIVEIKVTEKWNRLVIKETFPDGLDNITSFILEKLAEHSAFLFTDIFRLRLWLRYQRNNFIRISDWIIIWALMSYQYIFLKVILCYPLTIVMTHWIIFPVNKMTHFEYPFFNQHGFRNRSYRYFELTTPTIKYDRFRT